MKSISSTIIVVGVCLLSLLLLDVTAISAQSWKAKWITTGLDTVDTKPNSWICYRYQFNVNRTPKNALARIATDTKYWLYINGKMVVYEGGLKRGPTPRDTFYDELDIAPYLKKGKNVIAILVWYWGGNGFSHNSSGRSALLFDCQTPDFVVLSSHHWRVTSHTAYGSSIRQKPNFRLSEPSIFYDARRALDHWYESDYDDGKWQQAFEYGMPQCAPWNDLVRRPIPLFKDFGIKRYISQVRRGDTLECTLPYNIHVSPRLKVSASAGQKIVVHSDTYWLGVSSPTDSLYTLRSEYITRDGEQEYESFGWFSGHKIQYIIPKDVKILEVSYRETGYNASFTGSFTCNDEFFNTLWTKSRRSFYVCMRDNFMDCPDRERAQWGGDAAIEMQQSFYALDTNSFALARKFYMDLAGWQSSDGTLIVPVPENEPSYKLELPAHSLMPLGALGSLAFFQHTHDASIISKIYPVLNKYLALWTQNTDGSLVYRAGGWDWGDWGPNQDRMLIQHGWYLLAMQAAERMASLMNDSILKEQYHARITTMKKYLNSPSCWNGSAYKFQDYQGETDDRAQALFVLAGVAEPSKYDAISAVLQKEYHSSPWMEKFVLEALFKMNMPNLALQRMKRRFMTMVNSDLSTLWELWTYNPAGGYHGNTGSNHGWSGGALILLSQYIGGVAPDETKSQYYHIMPMTGGLKQAKTEVNIPNGLITSSWKDSEHSFILQVVVPPGTTARLGVPKRNQRYAKLMLNNKHLTTVAESETHYYTDVSQGKWNFKVTY